MKTHDEKIAALTFTSVYPHYVTKVTKKGRTVEELNEVIKWLTGYTDQELELHIKNSIDFDTFFNQAKLHPQAHLITGVICGYRVENIENPLTQKVRYLDKIIDELAKGKSLSKIMRQPS